MAAVAMAQPLLRPVHEHRGVYHEGELAMQRRVGTYESAKGMGPNMISAQIKPRAKALFASSPHLFLASQEPVLEGEEARGTPCRVWASVLFGLPGFVQVAGDLRHLHVRSRIPAGDPLSNNLVPGAPVATIGINFEERDRYRINGRVAASPGGSAGAQPVLSIEALEAFGNCPKYIAARTVALTAPGAAPAAFGQAAAVPAEVGGPGLTEATARMVSGADTFFIATVHPARGADLSHRGGAEGFVRASEGRSEVLWADYEGNGMFQTLGNIEATGLAGLVFVDWATGSSLQISGTATVGWQGDAEKVDGSARIVKLKVEASVFITRRVPLSYVLPEDGLSPFNPGLSGAGASAKQGGGEQAVVALARVVRESENVKTLTFRPMEGSDALLRRLATHQPGEYATFQLPIGEGSKMVSRTWTISSAPGALMHDDPGVNEYPAFTISVKREDKGLASRYLHDELAIGARLTLTGVGGGDSMSGFSKWQLAAQPRIEVRTPRILLLSAGIGITPMMSNLRTFMLLHQERSAEDLRGRGLLPQLALVHSTQTLPVWPFAGELSEMLRCGVLSHFVLTVSRASGTERTASSSSPAAAAAEGLEAAGARLVAGRVGAGLLAEHVAAPEDLTVFICGPAGFMKACEEVLHGLGVDAARIRTESFYF